LIGLLNYYIYQLMNNNHKRFKSYQNAYITPKHLDELYLKQKSNQRYNHMTSFKNNEINEIDSVNNEMNKELKLNNYFHSEADNLNAFAFSYRNDNSNQNLISMNEHALITNPDLEKNLYQSNNKLIILNSHEISSMKESSATDSFNYNDELLESNLSKPKPILDQQKTKFFELTSSLKGEFKEKNVPSELRFLVEYNKKINQPENQHRTEHLFIDIKIDELVCCILVFTCKTFINSSNLLRYYLQRGSILEP